MKEEKKVIEEQDIITDSQEQEVNTEPQEQNTKPETKKSKKPIVKVIIDFMLWVIILVWVAICLIDFYHVRQKEDPQFCIKTNTTKYDDGEVNSCLGLGYKVYNYRRDSYNAVEFGPFWIKDRSNNK